MLQRYNRLLQYNFMVALRNLNCIDSNLLHGPPATPAATGPRVRPISLIFLYKMFFLHLFMYPITHHGVSLSFPVHDYYLVDSSNGSLLSGGLCRCL
jgi:hypothetical protein